MVADDKVVSCFALTILTLCFNSAEDLAQQIVKASANAENGSVWTCDENVMEKIAFKKFWPKE